MSVSVVVVNWNSGALISDCVESIGAHGSKFVDRIIVVDNGSADGSDRFVEQFSDVDLIRVGENLGFGKACNRGAKHAVSEFLLFLNPDAALYSGTLGKAVAFMQEPANMNIAICGVQLIDEVGHIARSCSRFPSNLQFFLHAVGVDRIFPRVGHIMADWDHGNTREVDHVIGAFFLVRRKVFVALGGFDERFFVYLEDLDFSYRAHQAGWKCAYLADARAYHAEGGASRQVKARRLFYSLRSRVLYSFKHFSVPGATAVLFATLLIEPLSRSLLAIARRSWIGLKETWSAYGMLWRWLPQWVFKGATR